MTDVDRLLGEATRTHEGYMRLRVACMTADFIIERAQQFKLDAAAWVKARDGAPLADFPDSPHEVAIAGNLSAAAKAITLAKLGLSTARSLAFNKANNPERGSE